MKIENFRSIKSETIEFHDLTLLVGANDHGKSNLLKAIDAFFNREIDPGGFLIDNSFYEQNKRRDSGSSPLRITALIGNLPAGLQYTKRKLKQVPISIQFYADGDARVSFNSMELDRPKRHHNDQAYEKLIAIRDHFHVTYVPTFRNIEAELDPFANKSILFQMLSAYLGNAIERQQGGTSSEYRTMKRVKNEIDTLLKDSFDEIRQNAEKYLPSSLANTKFAFRFIPENTEDSRDLELSKILAKRTCPSLS